MLKIEVYRDGRTWCARGIGEAVFTQGKTYEDLLKNIQEAVEVHFNGGSKVPEILLISELKLASRAETTASKR